MMSKERSFRFRERNETKADGADGDIRPCHPSFPEAFSLTNLYDAWRKCEKGVSWKGSVQSFHNHAPTELLSIHRKLEAGTLKTGGFHNMTIMDRGKLRHISSVQIRERVVQRCLCDNVLVPAVTPKLIYDNAACVKGKGMHFAIKRIKRYLHRYWMKYGNEGYILQYDFHGYFDSIPHEGIKSMVAPLIEDDRIRALYDKLVDDFPGEVGLGLGSQISQISALYYPHEIDNAFANDPEIMGYGRYMDDGYLISYSKEKLRDCMTKLREMATSLGLEINEKKTHITKFGTNAFEFLKCRISMLPNGRIIVRPNKKNVTRNRRKIKKFRKLVDDGVITLKQAEDAYKVIVGNLRNFDAYKTAESFRLLFESLFPELIKQKPGR